MILNAEKEALLPIVKAMALAARTAPKARGVDNLVIAVLEPADIEKLAVEMERIAAENNAPGFKRDAGNIRLAPAALLIGTRAQTTGLNVCGLCGHENCAANEKAQGICVFNTNDLGIAAGSAVAVAAQYHVDNRIMYTVGLAAVRLMTLGEGVRFALGIPLSATGKNPFFDRS